MFNAPVFAAGLLVVAACGLAVGFLSGRADANSRYLITLERLEEGSYAARGLCKSLTDADWERCITKALTDKWRAIADADAAHRNTPESYRVQRFVSAGTAFLMQMQQCNALPQATRTSCDRGALEAYRQAVSRISAPELSEQRGCVFRGCPTPADLPGGRAQQREV